MVEAALLKFDGGADVAPLEDALEKHEEWYLGDGTYGDGKHFRRDYYNSFVIQPMVLDILKNMNEVSNTRKNEYDKVRKLAIRYAATQERLISSDGTYPPIGRSIVYRFGAFQSLAQIALFNKLPEEIHSAQVRSALHLMIRNQLSALGTFDKEKWLKIGLNS